MYLCALGLGILRVRFLGFFCFFFFQLFASFLVELKATVMVVVVWSCHDVALGFIFVVVG